MRKSFGGLVIAGIVSALTGTLGMSAASQSKSTVATAKTALSQAHARAQAAYRASAPADAYFGRLKMSILGIDNAFKDQSVRAGDHTADPDVVNKLKDADESLQAWVKQYPHDPELARTYFLASAAYKKVWTKESQARAWQYMHVVVDKFPQTYFGKLVKKDLAIGFTEHYFGDALPCPIAPAVAPLTASPEPTAAPPSKSARKGTPAPAPSAVPTAQPTEPSTPSPAPTPSEKPAPGQPKVEIVTPPCSAPTMPGEPSPAPAAASPSSAMPGKTPTSKASSSAMPSSAMPPSPVPPSATPAPAVSHRL